MMDPLADRPTIGTAELREALEAALRDHFGRPRRIVALARSPSWHRTSFAIEELDVTLDDGTCLPILFKDLSWLSMPASVRRIKPRFLHDPLREIETYRLILGPQRLGAPTCYGAAVGPEADRYWLFLERASETELHNMGEFAAWLEVARWLAGMHGSLAGRARRPEWSQAAHLLRYDGDFFRLWMRRALEFGRRSAAPQPGRGDRLEWLATRHDRAVERLVGLPITFLHGEFYASNVLVNETSSGLRVRPVDWELAAVGPGLLDVAALAAGGWSEDQKTALALAYRAALAPAGGWPTEADSFLAAFRCCRLHVAVQWLGWSPDWTPPVDFHQDWLGEALRLAEGLDE
jgi:hypothetical protein